MDQMKYSVQISPVRKMSSHVIMVHAFHRHGDAILKKTALTDLTKMSAKTKENAGENIFSVIMVIASF